MVDRAALLRLVGDQAVLAVEEQQMKALDLVAAHGNPAIGKQLLPGSDDRLVGQLFAGQPPGRFVNDLQGCRRGLANAGNAGQFLGFCRQHAGEAAEPGDQRLGDRFDIAPRNCAEQQELDHLVIGQRLGTLFEQPLTQAVAMFVIVRLFPAHPCVPAVQLGRRSMTWRAWDLQIGGLGRA
jgi:hypothetical protein